MKPTTQVGYFRTSTSYRIEFMTGGKTIPLIYPRAAGTMDSHFDVLSGRGPINVGVVRYIGDPATQTFAFLTSALTPEAADADNVQCEDGIDAVTGAICVDDEDEADDEEDGVDCEDGIDTATGLECDGGPAANAND